MNGSRESRCRLGVLTARRSYSQLHPTVRAEPMAWIESHQSLATHRKTMALEAALGIDTPQAVGHLHLLWWWALDNAPDGDLSNVVDAVIARGAQWRGKAGDFVAALTASGFLDEGQRQIHDWNDYAGRLVAQREKNRERMRAQRAAHVLARRPPPPASKPPPEPSPEPEPV